MVKSNLERRKPGAEREFFQKTLDSMLSHIAILSEKGAILAVNAPWKRYATCNGLEENCCGPGANYLQACDLAAGTCSEEARRVAQGIRDVIARRTEAFSLEYPCHSPTERRWFSVRITGFEVNGNVRVVVSHDDITQRKLAELRLRKSHRLLSLQASTDGLTGIPNRRIFDRELDRAWKRLERSGSMLGVLLIDVDCFKQYNDNFGHLAGDDCLKAVAGAIRSTVNRAGGLAARYGGEEFSAILPEAGDPKIMELATATLEAIRLLAIPHPHSRVGRGMVTVSIGGSTTHPTPGDSPARLLHWADRALYEAKSLGRDRAVSASTLEPATSASGH